MNTVGARKFLADAKDLLRTYGCDITEESTVLAMLSLDHVRANANLPRVICTMMSSQACADIWNSSDELDVIVGSDEVHVFCGKSSDEIVARLKQEDQTCAMMYEDTLRGADIGGAGLPTVSIFYSDHLATYSLRTDREARRAAMANSIAPMLQDIFAAFDGRVSGLSGQMAIIGSIAMKGGEVEAYVSPTLPAMSAVDMVATNEEAPAFAMECQKRFAAFGKCVGIVVVDDQDNKTKEMFFFNFIETILEGERLTYPDLTEESLVFRLSKVEMN